MKKRYTFFSRSWLFRGLSTAFATFLSMNVDAQNTPAIQWDRTFGGSLNDHLYSMQQTTDGGFILGGSSQSGINGDKSQASRGNSDYWVVKLDAIGNKVWDKTFGTSNHDHLFSLKQTQDGGYILVGTADSGISGDKTQASKGFSDFWIIKLDANGNQLWDKAIGGNSDDFRPSILQTADGGYIVGGVSKSGISGDKSQASKGLLDQWVVKLDSNGNVLWDRSFGGNYDDYLTDIRQTSDGGFILGGYSYSDISSDKTEAGRGGFDFWVVKLDAVGNKQWDKTLGGNNHDGLSSLQQTFDGGFILGGYSSSDVSGDKSQPSKSSNKTDYWIVKLDATGNKQWDKTIGTNSFDDLHTVLQTTDGGFILGGYSDSGINGDKSQISQGAEDYWIVKLDAFGNKLWDKSVGGNNTDELKMLQQTSDGGFLLGGSTASSISGDKTQANKGGADIWIVKLSSGVTGINETKSDFPITVFPNPNQGKFNLKLNDLTTSTLEVTISDLLGRNVLHKNYPVTDNQLSEEINLPNTTGMFQLQIKSGTQVITRKIIVD